MNRIAGGLPLKKPVNDMDLTVECHEIIKKLPIKVKFKWLPGHKRADDLLSKIQRTVQPAAKQRNSENSTPTSILPPSYKIAISYKGQLIPTNLRKIVQKVAHTTDLQETVMKNTGWTLSQFKEINWLAQERAFLSLGHFHQISICKLVHNLICTNNTQKRYYGKPDLCPRCEVGSESMSQLLCCPSKYSSNHRRIAQEELVSQLNNIGTHTRENYFHNPLWLIIICQPDKRQIAWKTNYIRINSPSRHASHAVHHIPNRTWVGPIFHGDDSFATTAHRKT